MDLKLKQNFLPQPPSIGITGADHLSWLHWLNDLLAFATVSPVLYVIGPGFNDTFTQIC